MTKARDLAGFASSSVTTTASDGLVLKGDGSSTDVVIKNGANATVASVADGTVNIAAAGSITATGASVGALAQGAIQVGNSSGVAAPLTIGSNTQLLQSNGTTAAWATISTGTPDVVFPSNWASPTNTYTSSGTWSKGSLADDDYVWIYLIGGGGGGGSKTASGSNIVNGGNGGSPLFLYGKAQYFNGGAYVVADGKAGNTAASFGGTTPNHTTFTLSSANGSTVYTTNITGDTTSSRFFTVFPEVLDVVDLASFPDYTLVGKENETTAYSDTGLPSGVAYRYLAPGKQYNGPVAAEHCIFGGGNGAGFQSSAKLSGTSEFCGAGGATAAQGANGTAPGGGGGGSQNSSNVGGSGAQGAVRTYHV